MTDLHAVFAIDYKRRTFRVSDPLPWDRAISTWRNHEDDRAAGSYPQWKFLEVRSVRVEDGEVHSHDHYDRAPSLVIRRVRKSRSYLRRESATRAALRALASRRGLARTSRILLQASSRIVQGGDGRWYVMSVRL